MKKTRLPFTDNFAFKAIFAQHEDLLLDLLNSFPEFSGEKKIVSLKVLNPELPKLADLDKLSVLDIHAQDQTGSKFLIEMQAHAQENFGDRITMYWSRIFGRALRKGQDYKKLPRVVSIAFTDFNFLDTNEYHTLFQIRSSKNPKLLLTDLLEIHIIELKKSIDQIENLKTSLEEWLFALKYGHTLNGAEMNTLVKKNPKIKKAIKEWSNFNSSPKTRDAVEARLKGLLDYNAKLAYERKQGIEQGIEIKNIETVIRMSEKNQSLDFISEVTGLSIPEIVAIQKKHSKK